MRLVATGTKPRCTLAVIVYDSSQPPTTRTEMENSSLTRHKPDCLRALHARHELAFYCCSNSVNQSTALAFTRLALKLAAGYDSVPALDQPAF
jgi:hypothetical protein